MPCSVLYNYDIGDEQTGARSDNPNLDLLGGLETQLY